MKVIQGNVKGIKSQVFFDLFNNAESTLINIQESAKVVQEQIILTEQLHEKYANTPPEIDKSLKQADEAIEKAQSSSKNIEVFKESVSTTFDDFDDIMKQLNLANAQFKDNSETPALPLNH